ARITHSLTNDPLLSLCVSLPTGMSLIVLAFLLPFAMGINLPLNIHLYTILLFFIISFGMDLFFVIRHRFSKIFIEIKSSSLRILVNSPEKYVLIAFIAALIIRLAFQSYNVSS